jgi:hypothetical protein
MLEIYADESCQNDHRFMVVGCLIYCCTAASFCYTSSRMWSSSLCSA